MGALVNGRADVGHVDEGPGVGQVAQIRQAELRSGQVGRVLQALLVHIQYLVQGGGRKGTTGVSSNFKQLWSRWPCSELQRLWQLS